ncbi:hypothetical protein [Daejeonella sp.]|uniref:hypothetical protein n=1 Tax=Daejeonella sp. TaxID=2805397 RepID=UPI002731D744|nr:hypothetical protein [Daejeonella sp.]MDP2414843.1 hypothetical protein [Daejeonella sp.]
MKTAIRLMFWCAKNPHEEQDIQTITDRSMSGFFFNLEDVELLSNLSFLFFRVQINLFNGRIVDLTVVAEVKWGN